MQTPEITPNTPEQHKDSKEALERAGHERRKELQEQLERKSHEESPENNESSARHEALERATSVKHEIMSEERQSSPAERRHPIGKKERETSFKSTMKEVQSQMDAPSRAFSKVIHNNAVEQVSEATSNTIARPNALLAGAVFAFILTLAVYLIAKSIGYPLSGFESIGAFILGWAIGLVYDFLKVMVTGRK